MFSAMQNLDLLRADHLGGKRNDEKRVFKVNTRFSSLSYVMSF